MNDYIYVDKKNTKKKKYIKKLKSLNIESKLQSNIYSFFSDNKKKKKKKIKSKSKLKSKPKSKSRSPSPSDINDRIIYGID